MSPQRGTHSAIPDVEFERPTCEKCGWAGDPVPVLSDPHAYADDGNAISGRHEGNVPEEPCIIPTQPLRELLKPRRREDD